MFCCDFCVFIVLKPLCFKIWGLFFVVFLLLMSVFFENIFYILTKALAEVEEKTCTRMQLGSSDSSRRGKWK